MLRQQFILFLTAHCHDLLKKFTDSVSGKITFRFFLQRCQLGFLPLFVKNLLAGVYFVFSCSKRINWSLKRRADLSLVLRSITSANFFLNNRSHLPLSKQSSCIFFHNVITYTPPANEYSTAGRNRIFLNGLNSFMIVALTISSGMPLLHPASMAFFFTAKAKTNCILRSLSQQLGASYHHIFS